MKTSKKCLSLFLAAFMLLSVVSVPAVAEETSPLPTVISTNADVIGGYFGSSSTNDKFIPIGTDDKNKSFIISRAASEDNLPKWSYNNVGALGYDISAVWQVLADNPGYAVKSAKLKLGHAVADPNAVAEGNHFNFYMLDCVLTSSTTYAALPANTTNYPVWNDAPDVTVAATSTRTPSWAWENVAFDITPILTRHMMENENQTNKNTLSFAIEVPEANTSYRIWGHDEVNPAAGSFNPESGRPPVLTIEYCKPEPLSLTSSSLPKPPQDDMVLTYNNNIKSAAVKINGVNVDAQYISIDGNTVTIDNEPFERCNVVEVSVIDEYNYSMSSTYTFATDKDSGAGTMIKVDYNSDSAAATVYYISQEYSGHSVTVSLVDTSDESVCYTCDLATNSDGVLIHNIENVSNDASYIVYVTPYGGEASHADVVTEAYTTYLWNLAAQSTDAEEIAERFAIICSTFGLTVGYSDKIDDIDDFYDKLATLRASYPIGEQNAENEAKLKAAFEEIGLFTATEDINSPSDARESYDAMLAKIADRTFAAKLAELETSDAPFFADVYDGFVRASKTINSYDDFEALLKASYNTEKSAVLLGEFASMTHLSQVGALLTDSETIDAFGIQTLVDRYNALNSTSEVDNALYGKTFADNSAFISTLSSALTSGERVDPPAPQKPKPSPSKGGSAIVGAIGAPVVNNENISYKDLAGYDWAKQHIDALSADGIINGKGDGEFDPAGKVLREEAVKMIVEAFDITASGNAAFDDVSSADWFRGFVLTAKNAGIVNGVSASSFGAGLSITRQDAAVMLFTALSKKGLASAAGISDSSFADDADIAAYARDAVAYMNSVGAITGYADGTFKPSSTITRAEFAVVLGRIYNTLK